MRFRFAYLTIGCLIGVGACALIACAAAYGTEEKNPAQNNVPEVGPSSSIDATSDNDNELNDATPDRRPASDAGPCGHQLCESFDNGPPGPEWKFDGTVSVVGLQSSSPPLSARFISNGMEPATVTLRLPPAPTGTTVRSIRCGAMLRTETTGERMVRVLSLMEDDDEAILSFALRSQDGPALVTKDQIPFPIVGPTSFDFMFTPFAIEIDLAGGNAVLTLGTDKVVVPVVSAPRITSVVFGIVPDSPGTTEWRTFMDDLFCDQFL